MTRTPLLVELDEATLTAQRQRAATWPATLVAEQLGLALGRPRVVEVAFRVVSEKSAHQLLLREVFLEFAADAVLHRRDV